MQWIDGLSPAMERQLVALARRVIEQHPDQAACWGSLSATLRTSGRPEEALAVLDDALARFPDDTRLLLGEVRAARMIGDWPRVLAASEKIAALRPGTKSAQLLRSEALFRMKDDAAAIALLPLLDGTGSGNRLLLDAWMKQLKREDRSEEMLALCDAHMASPRTRTSAIFYKSQLLLTLGRDAPVRAMFDLDRLLQIEPLDCPPGYADGAAFREALAAEILRNPTLVADPASKATRNGLQTRALRQADAPAVEALLGRIREHVARYIASHAEHPFAATAPARARLNAWAVVYRAAGRQLVHHHGSGWLSGVFYVRAPRKADGGGYGSGLLLGALTIDDGQVIQHPGVREIEPVPGRLLLFPSFVPHATLPPDDDDSRIVVAFDVAPEFSSPDDEEDFD